MFLRKYIRGIMNEGKYCAISYLNSANSQASLRVKIKFSLEMRLSEKFSFAIAKSSNWGCMLVPSWDTIKSAGF